MSQENGIRLWPGARLPKAVFIVAPKVRRSSETLHRCCPRKMLASRQLSPRWLRTSCDARAGRGRDEDYSPPPAQIRRALLTHRAYMRGRLSRDISVVLSEILSYIQTSWVFFELWFRFESKASPLRGVQLLAAATYIRPGSTRSRIPHAHCEGAGLQGGMGPFSSAASFSPSPVPVTHPPWIS
jgi:hypothetical protein